MRPAWLSDAEENEKPAAPLVTAVREPAAAVESAESLEELTERLEKLDKLMNQTKGQLLSYLVHRDSQSGSADSGKLVGDQFEGLVEKLVAFGRTLDAIYGKVNQLANAAPRARLRGLAGDGGGPGLSEEQPQGGRPPGGREDRTVRGQAQADRRAEGSRGGGHRPSSATRMPTP